MFGVCKYECRMHPAHNYRWLTIDIPSFVVPNSSQIYSKYISIYSYPLGTFEALDIYVVNHADIHADNHNADNW